MIPLSYVLPIRVEARASDEFFNYVNWLSRRVQVIVVDGSPGPVFQDHARRLASRTIHIQPDGAFAGMLNQKVAGVITGGRRASHPLVIVADDDVRYDEAGLTAMAHALEHADVVRPQNYFDPVNWHAWIDTGRTLLNRISGGDWPGTLGVRWPILQRTQGYDGNVLFENLELVRTVQAAGGSEYCALDLYVRRLPPTATHFLSQRVRQAYDELARPLRLAAWLAIAPTVAALVLSGYPVVVGGLAAATVAGAEAGRRRAGGGRVFQRSASLAAPLWVCERAVCAWIAVAAYVLLGGVPYRAHVITRAATPLRVLRQRTIGG